MSEPRRNRNESERTPGPWECEVHELSTGISAIVYGRDGMRVGTDHLSEADAHLIAAAPDLYEALKAMADRWEPDGGGTDRIMWESARTALAKARGETP